MNKFIELVKTSPKDPEIFAKAAQITLMEKYGLYMLIEVDYSYQCDRGDEFYFDQHWIFYMDNATRDKIDKEYGWFTRIISQPEFIGTLRTGTASSWHRKDFEFAYHIYMTVNLNKFGDSFDYLYSEKAKELLIR